MCQEVRKRCQCGRQQVQFHLRDNVMLPEVIDRLFCPQCPGDEGFDPGTMLNDNGWIIAYDMELARALAANKLGTTPEDVTPAFLFDNGYACWLEMYPGERQEIAAERAAIVKLLDEDQRRYLEAIQRWNVERVARLKAAGWRRAQAT